MLTAAVMGSLICALLLVVAVSCTCRLHALRTLEHRLASHRLEPPLSSSHRLSREFFFCEPPPSYAAAVQGSHSLYVENFHYSVPPVHHRPASGHRRRGRHHRHSRHTGVPSPLRNAAVAPERDGRSLSCGTLPLVDTSTLIALPVQGDSACSSKNDSPVQQPDGSESVVGTTSKDDTVCSRTANGSDCTILACALEISSQGEDLISSSDSVLHYCCDSDSEPLVA